MAQHPVNESNRDDGPDEHESDNDGDVDVLTISNKRRGDTSVGDDLGARRIFKCSDNGMGCYRYFTYRQKSNAVTL